MSDASRPAKRARTTKSPAAAPPSRASKASPLHALDAPPPPRVQHHSDRHRNRRVPSNLANPTSPSPQAPRSTTTTISSSSSAAAAAAPASPAINDADEDDLPLSYVPHRDIPPIAPTPPAQCPIPHARASLLSRRYDLASGQPLYRVRVEHLRPRRRRSRSGGRDSGSAGRSGEPPADGANDDLLGGGGAREEAARGQGRARADDGGDDGDDDDDDDVAHTEDVAVWLADVLAYVSAAELERFELGHEDDVVVMVDGDGAVLLVSKEVQQEMMGWGGGGPRPAAVDGPGAGGELARGKRKKPPTQAFVDTLPPARKRGRPRKIRTMEVMGAVADRRGDTGDEHMRDEKAEEEECFAEVVVAADTGSESQGYSTWVDPASVRGTAPYEETARAKKAERDEHAFSENSSEHLGLWRAGAESGQPSAAKRRSRRSSRSRATSHVSSRIDPEEPRAERGRKKNLDTFTQPVPPRDVSVTSTTSSQLRESRSTKGARLRRSSISLNGSTAESFHSAINQHRSTSSTVAISQSSSVAAAENGATSPLNAFGSKQASQRKSTRRMSTFVDLEATPRASQQTKSSKHARSEQSEHRNPTTTSALHQSSSMLHPPAEGASWEPDVPEEVEEYEIEGIIRHKRFAGDTYYLVKWANWPEDNESWFTAEELSGAREVLEDYLNSVRRRKLKSKGKARRVEGEFSEEEVGEDNEDVDLVGS